MDFSLSSLLSYYLRRSVLTEKKEQRIGEGYFEYAVIWFLLISLTFVTVGVSHLHLGRFSIITSLLIAVLKSSLILYYFMHLKYEIRLFKIMLLVAVLTLSMIIGLTFFDISFR